KGNLHDIGNYLPICLLPIVYKLFTRVILNRIDRTLDEGQPWFRQGFSMMHYIYTITKLTEVSRKQKTPLCHTFIDLKKAFDSIEIEAVMEALGSQGVPTQYIKILRELYKKFATSISSFGNDINVDVKRGVREDDTISSKLF
ncbi:hypothetical protein Angca_003004, partial [Angiostrongylus cantonensis]